MDQKTMDFVLNAIESLRSDQKTIAKKLITLSEAFKNSLNKMKKEKAEENTAMENKLQGLTEKCDKLRLVIDNHEDGMKELNLNKCNLERLIKKIDDNLEDVNKKIGESLLKIENLKTENHKFQIKQCIFDRKGFCKEEENCRFFHPLEICSDYIENRVCIKTCCRKRHPRLCRYFTRGICRRGESCKYLHDPSRQENNCNRCHKNSPQKYYCEFCKKSFCPECTVKEAHTMNIYNTNDGLVTCSNIHN
jgi:hypothetical protein